MSKARLKKLIHLNNVPKGIENRINCERYDLKTTEIIHLTKQR
jgi:hypothetical protein